jgi:hypothetical protein
MTIEKVFQEQFMRIGSIVTAGRASKTDIFADPSGEKRNLVRKDAKPLASGMVPFSPQDNEKATVYLPKGEKLEVVGVRTSARPETVDVLA